jgi:multimeric flavodoxin WrbA
MKVLTLFGSPSKKGNTAKAVDWLEEELKEAGHEMERVHLATKKIAGCLGCYKCQTFDDFRCTQKDDGNSVFEQMAAADAIVFASPLYFWSFSAQLKLLIDRLVSQTKGYGTKEQTSSVQAKPIALLATCWGGIEVNSECMQEEYKRLAEYLMGDDKGALVIPGCAPMQPPGEEYEKPIKELARALIG